MSDPWRDESIPEELRRNAAELRADPSAWVRGTPRQPGQRCAVTRYVGLTSVAAEDGYFTSPRERALSERAQETVEAFIARMPAYQGDWAMNLPGWNDVKATSAEDVAGLFEAVADFHEGRTYPHDQT